MIDDWFEAITYRSLGGLSAKAVLRCMFEKRWLQIESILKSILSESSTVGMNLESLIDFLGLLQRIWN